MSIVEPSHGKTRWPLSVLIRRVLWTYFLEPLVSGLPKPMSPLRILALRWMGASIGSRCLIARGVKVLMPWNLTLGDQVVIGSGVELYNYAPIHVGTRSVVSQGSYLCTGSHDFRVSSFPLIYSPITIGRDCWLAAGVFVCPGVSVADGVVVGARSVVTKSVTEPWTIQAGHPAVRLSERRMRDAPSPLLPPNESSE
jgi:putative colanic acid biosynthesis acetyltransferase WcaF